MSEGESCSTFAEKVRASTYEDFVAAADRIRGPALHTPLIPFETSDGRSLRLKAENLQPLGSFKIRCGLNALAALTDQELAGGIATVSAGNFAQGLAVAAKWRGVQVTAHVPESASAVKMDALRSLGVAIVPQSIAEWMRIALSHHTGRNDGVFIHPVAEPAVIHGNGTIAIELVKDWPAIDTIVVPVGGGGLATGIALAFQALGREIRVVGCEIEGAAPLAAAKRAGRPVPIECQRSFVDAIGSSTILDEMWPLLDALVDDVVVVPLEAARHALQVLATRHHMIVEGAGAVALAAALSPQCGGRNVAAILTGGNIDSRSFCEILVGGGA